VYFLCYHPSLDVYLASYTSVVVTTLIALTLLNMGMHEGVISSAALITLFSAYVLRRAFLESAPVLITQQYISFSSNFCIQFPFFFDRDTVIGNVINYVGGIELFESTEFLSLDFWVSAILTFITIISLPFMVDFDEDEMIFGFKDKSKVSSSSLIFFSHLFFAENF